MFVSNSHCRKSSLVVGSGGKIAWTSVTIERERIILETTLTGVNVNIASTFCFCDGSTLCSLVEGHNESPASSIDPLKTSKHGDTCRVSQLHRHTKDMLQICDIEKYRFLKFTMTFSVLVHSRGKV